MAQREVFGPLGASEQGANYTRDRVVTWREAQGIGSEALDATVHKLLVPDYELQDVTYNVTVTGDPAYVNDAIHFVLGAQQGVSHSVADNPLQPRSAVQDVRLPGVS